MKNKPFKNFYLAEDICKCKNKKCKSRFDCFRYMSKSTQWQSMTTYRGTDKHDCENYIPYYIWKDANNKNYLLKDITDQHLMSIIVHIYQRIVENKEIRLCKLVKEFVKEAKIRKIIR